MFRPHTGLSRTRRTAEVDHQGSGTYFVWKNIGFPAFTISQKRISCEPSSKLHWQHIHQHHLQSHWHYGNDPSVANHNGIPSATHPPAPLATPFTMRNRSDHDPPMIRPHTRPSRTRRTAEVDHRGSGTLFEWKNIGFRTSTISQNAFRARFPSQRHRQLIHQHHLQSHLHCGNNQCPNQLPLWLTLSVTNSFFAKAFFANSFFDYLIYPD